MNIKRIGIGTLVTLVVVSIYGTLIWFGMHSDALDTHEREIESLQGELLETAKVNKILQQGLLGDIQELEDRIASSEDDTRSLVADTDRSLRETVECPIKPDNADKSRRILTRAMGRTADTGTYLFGATFNINTDGTTEYIKVAGDGPSDLRKAVARYTAALEWTVDEAANNCELKLKLDVE